MTWNESGIIINSMHRRDQPVLRAIPFIEGDELRIRQAFPNTTAGRDAAEKSEAGGILRVVRGIQGIERNPPGRGTDYSAGDANCRGTG